jgi:hypothetical protein
MKPPGTRDAGCLVEMHHQASMIFPAFLLSLF